VLYESQAVETAASLIGQAEHTGAAAALPPASPVDFAQEARLPDWVQVDGLPGRLTAFLSSFFLSHSLSLTLTHSHTHSLSVEHCNVGTLELSCVLSPRCTLFDISLELSFELLNSLKTSC
jgi:hypothetical protein